MPSIPLGKRRNLVTTNRVREYQIFYQNKAWKKLQIAKLRANPLCEICEIKNKVVLAKEVHHKKPWHLGKTLQDKWELFLNWSNLQSLCTTCHHIEDEKLRKNKM